MNNFDFSGVMTALVTPFKQGQIDFDSFERLVNFQIEAGIQGLVVNGTTAESPTLTESEVKELFLFVKKQAKGKIPVLIGTGSNSTQKTLEATKNAENLGADGALIVTPYYNRPSQRGLVEHFGHVAKNVKIPILLYNIPGRTITELALETLVTLSEVENIIGVKDASGSLEFLSQLKASCKKDFAVISGDDLTCMKMIQEGGHGVISVVSNIFPKEMVNLSNMARDGQNVEEEYSKYSGLNNSLYLEANPIPLKMALYLLGRISTPDMRLPLTSMEGKYAEALKSELLTMGALK